MLQFAIVPSKGRDTAAPVDAGPPDVDPADAVGGWPIDDIDPKGAVEAPTVRRLNARSLALSALLGTHPPALPTRAFVALAELFGIAGGTMRTALSRMSAAGEVEATTGWYRLTGRLLERQQSQDIGRRPPRPAWDGRWHTVIAAADQRDLADRRHFRAILSHHRFGELRPDTWLRPANLAAPELGGSAFVLTGTVDRSDEPELVRRLWDLPALAQRSEQLLDRIERLRATTDLDDHASIPDTFTLAAAIVRFLRSDPLLPGALTPDDWPVDRLRERYDRLESDLQSTLRDFLRSQRA